MLLALYADKKDLLTVLIENGTDINTPTEDVRKSYIELLRLFPGIMSN